MAIISSVSILPLILLKFPYMFCIVLLHIYIYLYVFSEQNERQPAELRNYLEKLFSFQKFHD